MSPFGEVKIFHEKMSTGPAIEILWKFHTFSKFTKSHQTYRINWNHHLKHACEIWVHLEKLKFFMKKMPSGPAIEILWKFHTFSKFTKFHQTYRIYWNHHLKHACEIWVHSEKLNFFMKKCRQCRLLYIMKFPHLFKVHQISSNWRNSLKSSSETCKWNLSPFGEVK